MNSKIRTIIKEYVQYNDEPSDKLINKLTIRL